MRQLRPPGVAVAAGQRRRRDAMATAVCERRDSPVRSCAAVIPPDHVKRPLFVCSQESKEINCGTRYDVRINEACAALYPRPAH